MNATYFWEQFSNGEIIFGKSVIFELSTKMRVVAMFGTGPIALSIYFPVISNGFQSHSSGAIEINE